MSHPLVCILFLAVFVAMSLGATATSPTTRPANGNITVMTFNVRYGSAPDGPDDWPHRRELFFKTIRSHDPDLLGMQEVLAFQADELCRELADYTFVGVGRDDGKRAGEYSPIMFRTKRFELLDKGFFWLSERPDVPGNVGWDAALTRMASWVKLRDRFDHDRQFLFLNTHWDHKGIQAHVESAKLIRRMMRRLGGESSIIMTGDLNADEDSDAFKLLLHGTGVADDRLELLDAYREVHPHRESDEATFHAFKGTAEGSRIDFILHDSPFSAVDAQIDRAQQDGHYPSDHFPVIARLRAR